MIDKARQLDKISEDQMESKNESLDAAIDGQGIANFN
jgi:hypothetical protein